MAVCKFALFEQQVISEMSAYTTGGAMAMATDYELMKKSIELARLSKSEGSKPHPFVGAIAARKGKILATACRGEAPGDHAEFTLIEKKMKNKNLAGCTIYTTLEPCTSRSREKVPCAKRLIENKVKKVFIGMLDPNPIITGRGELALTSAGIETAFYPKKLKSEILALNREFIRAQTQPESRGTVTEEFIQTNQGRSLDEWYEKVNRIYWNRQFYFTRMDVFAHLAEVALALSVLAGDRSKSRIDAQQFLVKALSWWMSLCGKLSIRSASELVWRKFPRVCPYCTETKHDPNRCDEIKKMDKPLDWEKLSRIGKKKRPPVTLQAWQKMFAEIYPPVFSLSVIFGRLAEELGEMSESLRVFPLQPGYFLSESADVFAWLMHTQNGLEHRNEVAPAKWGEKLQIDFCRAYPDCCTYCQKYPCGCPPIVPDTVGRIAKEVPIGRGAYGELGIFMTPELTARRFDPLRQ